MWVIPVLAMLAAVGAFALFVRRDAAKDKRRSAKLRMHRRR